MSLLINRLKQDFQEPENFVPGICNIPNWKPIFFGNQCNETNQQLFLKNIPRFGPEEPTMNSIGLKYNKLINNMGNGENEKIRDEKWKNQFWLDFFQKRKIVKTQSLQNFPICKKIFCTKNEKCSCMQCLENSFKSCKSNSETKIHVSRSFHEIAKNSRKIRRQRRQRKMQINDGDNVGSNDDEKLKIAQNSSSSDSERKSEEKEKNWKFYKKESTEFEKFANLKNCKNFKSCENVFNGCRQSKCSSSCENIKSSETFANCQNSRNCKNNWKFETWKNCKYQENKFSENSEFTKNDSVNNENRKNPKNAENSANFLKFAKNDSKNLPNFENLQNNENENSTNANNCENGENCENMKNKGNSRNRKMQNRKNSKIPKIPKKREILDSPLTKEKIIFCEDTLSEKLRQDSSDKEILQKNEIFDEPPIFCEMELRRLNNFKEETIANYLQKDSIESEILKSIKTRIDEDFAKNEETSSEETGETNFAILNHSEENFENDQIFTKFTNYTENNICENICENNIRKNIYGSKNCKNICGNKNCKNSCVSEICEDNHEDKKDKISNYSKNQNFAKSFENFSPKLIREKSNLKKKKSFIPISRKSTKLSEDNSLEFKIKKHVKKNNDDNCEWRNLKLIEKKNSQTGNLLESIDSGIHTDFSINEQRTEKNSFRSTDDSLIEKGRNFNALKSKVDFPFFDSNDEIFWTDDETVTRKLDQVVKTLREELYQFEKRIQERINDKFPIPEENDRSFNFGGKHFEKV